MKKQQSLQVLAMAGVAITILATGCSSTSSSQADAGSTDELAAYRFSSALGSVPITDIQNLNKFPMEWGPAAYESYTFRVPVSNQSTVDVGSAPSVETSLQPGEEVKVESSEVKRVVRYTPF